ncbi:MAG: hypothetical protein AAE983_01720 [Thermoplasmataceae archaeon]|jgi:hypothetical protein
MDSIIIFAYVLWFGVSTVAVAIGIYGMLYFARLMDITRRQLVAPITLGIVISALVDAFHYMTFTHFTVYNYDDIFTYAVLTIGPIIIVCLVYIINIGRRNLLEKYNIEIAGKWPKEIKRLKEMQR